MSWKASLLQEALFGHHYYLRFTVPNLHMKSNFVSLFLRCEVEGVNKHYGSYCLLLISMNRWIPFKIKAQDFVSYTHNIYACIYKKIKEMSEEKWVQLLLFVSPVLGPCLRSTRRGEEDAKLGQFS